MEKRGRTRVEWLGFDEVPQPLGACTELQVQRLRDRCEQMRAMRIERRVCSAASEHQLACSCLDRMRCIRTVRPTLSEALEAFERLLRSRCLPGIEEAPPADPWRRRGG